MSGSAKIYADYLTQEGYRPTIDSDGDVIFKEEGGTYYIDIDTSDEQYFRLVYPSFWKIENPEELARAIVAANHATMQTKVAKVYVIEGKQTSAAIEMFIEQPDQFKPVFHRSMSALKASVKNFVEKMK